MVRQCIFFLVFFLPILVVGQNSKIVVVIDPGHGGSDPGHMATYKNHETEKNINLAIALKFGSYLENNLKNIQVVYTRKDDSYPSLDQRVETANKIKADYFISIHCNANEKKSIHGTESHVHNHAAKGALSLAKIFEDEFSNRAGRNSRGIKDNDDREKSLQVLKYTNMTSVLVECGFLTNEREANYLNSTYGQEIIASALFRGLRAHMLKQFPQVEILKGQNSSSDKNAAYAIQIMSSKEKIDTEDSSFKKIGLTIKRIELQTKSPYKFIYTAGTYTTKDAAQNDLKKVQENGFKDAFVIKSN